MSNSITSYFDSDISHGDRIAQAYELIDNTIEVCVDIGDPEPALALAKELDTAQDLAGKALARLIYSLWQVWEVFDWGDNFIDTMSDSLGRAPHTIERYIKIPALLEKVPEEYAQEVEEKGINLLIPAANALAKGHEFTEYNWESLVEAKSEAAVRELVRGVTGAEPRKNALRLYLGRDGELQAFKGNSIGYVGHLEIDSDDPNVIQAIERITTNSGILKG